MKTLRIIFILVLSFIALRLNAQEDKIALMAKEYALGQYYAGTIDERYLSSKEANTTYKIQVYLPLTYTETQKKYPIMVLTDAFWEMGVAKTVFDLLSVGKEIPEVIVVGIGYPYSNSLDMARIRFKDMLPTHVEGFDPSGLADNFIAFIKKELLPYIENNYRVDTTDRCFCGHSFGGLLGSHILLEQSNLFNRYIIGSPSYWWDNKEIIKRLSSKGLLLDSVRAVYTYIGSEEGEMINDWKEFNLLLVNKINKNLRFHDQVYQDETHMSVVSSAFSTAIKFVYKQ